MSGGMSGVDGLCVCARVCTCDLTAHIHAVPGQEVEQHGYASLFTKPA